VENITRWKLYPFAITILPAKFFLTWLSYIAGTFLAWFPIIGADVSRPVQGFRARVQDFFLGIASSLVIFCAGHSYRF